MITYLEPQDLAEALEPINEALEEDAASLTALEAEVTGANVTASAAREAATAAAIDATGARTAADAALSVATTARQEADTAQATAVAVGDALNLLRTAVGDKLITTDQNVTDLGARLSEAEGGLTALGGRVADLEAAPPGTGSGYVGMPCTVITSPTNSAVQAGITAWLANRNGAFPKTRLVFAFIGTANLTTPLLPSNSGQIQGARIEGMSLRGTQLAWSNATTPMLTANGQLRNFTFTDLTFTSTAAGARGLYLWSDRTNSNQDGTFERVEFNGAWKYGIQLDGPVDANLNSEIRFKSLRAAGSFTATDGLFVSGTPGGEAQQDQFLNFWFEDCKFEGKRGRYIVLNKGGHVHVDGGSWIHVGEGSEAPVRGVDGEMIYMPTGSHFDSTMFLTATGVRAELRSSGSSLIDCGWGSRARLVFTGCDTSSKAYTATTAALVQEESAYRGGARATYVGHGFGGYVGHHGGTSGGGTTVLDGELISTPSGAGVTRTRTAAGGSGIVRYDTDTDAKSVLILR